MPDFTVRHPHWIDNANTWATAWDFYRGHRYVVTPGRQVGTINFWETTSGSDGTSPDRERSSRARYVPENTSSYLHSHVRESKSEYYDRVARSVHIPTFRPVLDVLATAVLATDAKREGSGAPWTDYWEDVDLAGTKIDAFAAQALTWALVYGRSHIVSDKPSFETQAVSRQAQIARGERAYSYVISPIDLVDWALDTKGQFVWAVIREDEPDTRVPGSETNKVKSQYRVWYRDRWELWRESDNGMTSNVSPQEDDAYFLAEVGTHSAGEVPIATVFARRSHESRRNLQADSMLAGLVDIDRTLFNQMSILLDQVYQQCFSVFAMPLEQGASLGNLELGTQRYVGFNSENGTPTFLSPDPNVLRIQWDLIQQEVAIARQLWGVSRGRAEHSKEERSAKTMETESQDKNNAVASLAVAIEEADRRHHRHVGALEGISKDRIPRATYNRKFSLRAVAEQIDEALSMFELQVPKTAMLHIVKPLYTRKAKELGVPDDEIEKGLSAIEEQFNEALGLSAPAIPSVGPFGFPQTGQQATSFEAKVDDGT